MARRYVVLDRDGTLIVERHYLSDPDRVELIAGAATALRTLQSMGWGLVLLTNQSGIGRGLFTAEQLDAIHERLVALLAAEGVRLTGIYVCPHRPEDGCGCRKPRPGLLERAARELGFAASQSIVVGDKPSDIEMGRRAGATTILVRTGYGEATAADASVRANHIVADVSGTVEILQALASGSPTAVADAPRLGER